jgi:hypothetical protein
MKWFPCQKVCQMLLKIHSSMYWVGFGVFLAEYADPKDF